MPTEGPPAGPSSFGNVRAVVAAPPKVDTPRREPLNDIRDPRPLSAHAKLIQERYAYIQKLRYERWLGLH